MTQSNIRLVEPDMLPTSRPQVFSGTEPTHIVQFYENDHFLAAAVADFLADGAAEGQPLLIVADALHRDSLTYRLKAKGFDTDRALRTGQMTILDARETMAAFMVDSKPDRERFHALLGGVLNDLGRGSALPTVRAYGEMVDILWKDGNTAGALQVEDLWNELAETHSFTLLCAYAMGNFYNEAHGAAFEHVCRHHAHVIPSESFTIASEKEQLVAVSLLQQRAAALESEIAHRKDLEARLRIALFEAEESNRIKSQFLSMMSHELRTPLNAIAGHVQLIEMGIHGPVTPAQQDALQRVQRSQRHLLALINDVLNLARSRAGTMIFEPTVIDSTELVESAIATLEPLITAHGLHRRVISEPLGARIMMNADAARVQQIVLNLLTNAIKFTPEGGRISVSIDHSICSPNTVCIRVEDTGIGIPLGKLDAIFEPFVQLLQSTPGAHDGLGLGLAISRDLARAMGGDLTAASAKGFGTTFLLTLPGAPVS